jgi:hypothetical protein
MLMRSPLRQAGRRHARITERQRDADARAAVRRIAEIEGAAGAVVGLQARPRVPQAHAFCRRSTFEPRPVVGHDHDEAVRVAANRDRDRAGARLRRPAVADGVFDDGLEQKARHARPHGLGIGVDAHVEAAAEARLLDGDVAPQQLQFRGERHFLAAADRFAQEHAQARDHLLGGVRVLVNQLGDRVQRVEEEVRLELRAQELEPGVGQDRLQPRRLELARPPAPVGVDAVHGGDHRAIEHELEGHGADQEVGPAAGDGAADEAIGRSLREGDGDASQQVHGDRARQMGRLNRPAARQPRDGRRQQPPQPPFAEGQADGQAPAAGPSR